MVEVTPGGYEVHVVDRVPIPNIAYSEAPYNFGEAGEPIQNGRHLYIGSVGNMESWWIDGLLSKKDGPALLGTGSNGNDYMAWYRDGQLHRMGEFAVVKSDGTEEWYQNNLRHRIDGPAIIELDGTEEWYQNGLAHRIGGPAVIELDGTEEWYQNGLAHRIGGPAVIKADGGKEWWQNNLRHRMDGPAVTTPVGEERWFQNDVVNRADGPAVIKPDGSEMWYRDGKLDRVGGPAVIKPDGSEMWYRDGKLDRVGGPAVVLAINRLNTFDLPDTASRKFITVGDPKATPDMKPGFAYQFWYDGKLLRVTDSDFSSKLSGLIYK